MKISFLGTGAAEGFPAVFCSCENCKNVARLGEREFRTRSQVVIDGELSVDFPSEAYAHALKFGVNLSALKYVLFTHSHMDHCYAHDFILRGYKYAKLECDVLQIYGNGEVEKVFGECTAREMKPTVASHVRFNLIHAYNELKLGDYRVLTLPAMHGTAEEALLYYIERGGKGYLHLYDTGNLSDEAIEYLAQNNAKADIVAFDCTFLDAPFGGLRRHMCLSDVEDVKVRLLAADVIDSKTKLVLTHFSHNANPTRQRLEEIEKRTGYIAAYDGMCIAV